MSVETIPILQTARLLLQGVSEKDAEPYEKYFVDYDIISELSAIVP
jgi:hypothetical protein